MSIAAESTQLGVAEEAPITSSVVVPTVDVWRIASITTAAPDTVVISTVSGNLVFSQLIPSGRADVTVTISADALSLSSITKPVSVYMS